MAKPSLEDFMKKSAPPPSRQEYSQLEFQDMVNPDGTVKTELAHTEEFKASFAKHKQIMDQVQNSEPEPTPITSASSQQTLLEYRKQTMIYLAYRERGVELKSRGPSSEDNDTLSFPQNNQDLMDFASWYLHWCVETITRETFEVPEDKHRLFASVKRRHELYDWIVKHLGEAAPGFDKFKHETDKSILNAAKEHGVAREVDMIWFNMLCKAAAKEVEADKKGPAIKDEQTGERSGQ